MSELQQGQIGINPFPYPIEKWNRYTDKGELIVSPEIDRLKNLAKTLYDKCPAFTTYSKYQVDRHAARDKSEASNEYLQSEKNYLVAIKIDSGFFVDHTIVIFDVEFNGNNFKTTYSAHDNGGNELKNPEPLQAIIGNIVQLMVVEQSLEVAFEELGE